jgi:hypothetical protein
MSAGVGQDGHPVDEPATNVPTSGRPAIAGGALATMSCPSSLCLANRQGRTLANILAGRVDRFPGAAGAAAVKVFDLNVAATGLTRTSALRLGLRASSAWVTAHDRAHYWPEAKEIVVHLVYDAGPGGSRHPGRRRGEGKRVDVATHFIFWGVTEEFMSTSRPTPLPTPGDRPSPRRPSPRRTRRRHRREDPLKPLRLPAARRPARWRTQRPSGPCPGDAARGAWAAPCRRRAVAVCERGALR